MKRAVIASLCCAALAFGLACGKYGPPERVAPREPASSAEALQVQNVENADIEERDAEKSPKR